MGVARMAGDASGANAGGLAGSAQGASAPQAASGSSTTASLGAAGRAARRKPAADRRDDIVCAARDLYATRGLAHTTVKDITEACGVSRGLFYHYFPDKDAVTRAVIDDMTSDVVDFVSSWNAERVPGDVSGDVRSCVRLIRRAMFDSDPLRLRFSLPENAALYIQFSQQVSEMLARYVVATTARDYERHHSIEIDHVYETFYMLITGLIGLLRRYPETPDAVIEQLIVQTLRLDVSGSRVGALADRDGERLPRDGRDPRRDTSAADGGEPGRR